MQIKNENAILSIILRERYVSSEDIDNALEQTKETNDSALNYLIENNYISMDLVGQAIAEHFKVPYADLNTNEPDYDQILRIPENIAKKFNVVLFKEDEKSVIVATSDPDNKEMIRALESVFRGKKISVAYSINRDIEKALSCYKSNLSNRFFNIINNEDKVAPEMIIQILEDAVNINASDIHFEPREEQTVIRFRVDGILEEVGKISYRYYENIINYLRMNILYLYHHLKMKEIEILYKHYLNA